MENRGFLGESDPWKQGKFCENEIMEKNGNMERMVFLNLKHCSEKISLRF